MFTILLFVCVCFATLVAKTDASAIPMWEFLTKQEKVSYLYSVYANQVEEFCQLSELIDCNTQLLKTGLKQLKEMSEDTLDFLDPYQRGADSLIWNAILDGHPVQKKKTTIANPITTPKPNSYEEDLTLSSDLPYQSENVNKVAPPTNFIYTPTIRAPSNGAFVVRVYPDGRPVQESTPLPIDDDLTQYRLTQTQLPNF